MLLQAGRRVMARYAAPAPVDTGPVVAAQQPDARAQLFQDGARALAEHRYADAERAYETLRQLSPDVAEVHASLGLSYFQQRKFNEAVPALRQALKLKPALPNVPVLLAMSLSELGRFDEALPGLQKGFAQSADPAIKRAAGPAASAGVHRVAARRASGRRGAPADPPVPEGSRGPVPRQPLVRELRVRHAAEAVTRPRRTPSGCTSRPARPTRARAWTTAR